jgi:hypothetical protein
VSTVANARGRIIDRWVYLSSSTGRLELRCSQCHVTLAIFADERASLERVLELVDGHSPTHRRRGFAGKKVGHA